MPRPPAQVLPYVEALGTDLAVTFLLTYGGAEMTLSATPAGAGHGTLIGPERAAALAAQANRLPKRVRPPSLAGTATARPLHSPIDGYHH